MPLYEYQCPKCYHKFERIAKPDDVITCEPPGCGDYVAKRLVPNKMSFDLKGDCWFKDGYTGKSNVKAS